MSTIRLTTRALHTLHNLLGHPSRSYHPTNFPTSWDAHGMGSLREAGLLRECGKFMGWYTLSADPLPEWVQLQLVQYRLSIGPSEDADT